MDKFLALAIGSMLGGFARWGISEAARRAVGGELPYGTFLANMTGCLCIGFLYKLGETRFSLSPQGRMLLIVGFCGAFTTFSTFMIEASRMADKGSPAGAFSYVAVSALLGFALVRVGLSAGGFLAQSKPAAAPAVAPVVGAVDS